MTQLAEYRAADSGATYSLWYALQKGFPPAGAIVAPDPGDGLGGPAVTITDLRPALAFGPLHNKNHGPQVYNSVAHTLIGSGDVFFTLTWNTDAAGRGRGALERAEVGGGGVHQVLERAQVVRQPGQDLVAAESQARHHVDGRVDGELPGLDALHGLDDALQGEPAGQGGAAVAGAGTFQLAGQPQLLFAVEQRDGAHLTQVQAQGVVRAVVLIRLGFFGRSAGSLRADLVVADQCLDRFRLAGARRRAWPAAGRFLDDQGCRLATSGDCPLQVPFHAVDPSSARRAAEPISTVTTAKTRKGDRASRRSESLCWQGLSKRRPKAQPNGLPRNTGAGTVQEMAVTVRQIIIRTPVRQSETMPARIFRIAAWGS